MSASLPPRRKPYQKPTMRKLKPEQAKLVLLGRVSVGDENARKLLEVLYPEPPAQQSANTKPPDH